MLRCSPRDIRDSADIGSPWVPVVISTTCSGAHHLGGGDVDQVGIGHSQESQLPGDAHVAHHRSPDERHPPAQCDCGIDDLLHPIHIGGEARHDDAAVGATDQPVQGRTDFAFRWPDAGDLGVGRVAQEQVHAGVAEPGHPGQIGGPPVQR